MKVLGIDYGTKRVGIAVSYGSLAQPLTILVNDENLLPQILTLAARHKVELIVVGESENVMAGLTRRFLAQLDKMTDLPLTLIDETLSTYQVRQYLRDHPAKKRRGPIDHLAAAVILQHYLNDRLAYQQQI